MESASPYTPPQTELLNEQEAYGTIRVLSARGRIGRLRYIGYTIGITFSYYLIAAIFTALGRGVESMFFGMLALIVVALGLGTMLFANIALTIQRCHDFNTTGWLSLVLLIPFLPFIFWLIPGTDGSNRFGLRPPPNKGVAVILAVAFVIILVIGILAAIAIPAYQDYMARAAAGM